MLLHALMAASGNSKNKINSTVNKILYTDNGQKIVAIIFGLAIAFLFKRVCKDRKCIVYKSPPEVEINGKTFEFDSECYKYTKKKVKCDTDANKSKVVN